MTDDEATNLASLELERVQEFKENVESLTKEEYLLQKFKKEGNPILRARGNEPLEKVVAEVNNPKLQKLLIQNQGAYEFDEENKQIDFNISKDALFSNNPNQRGAYDSMDPGDILINHSNGSSGVVWGHAGIVYSKYGLHDTWVKEAPGAGYNVQHVGYYNKWHADNSSKMSYNYVPRVYGTDVPNKAKNLAHAYQGTSYSIAGKLGDMSSVYCSELVWFAYYVYGVNVGGNDSPQRWDWNIVYPSEIYYDDDVMFYFRQNF